MNQKITKVLFISLYKDNPNFSKYRQEILNIMDEPEDDGESKKNHLNNSSHYLRSTTFISASGCNPSFNSTISSKGETKNLKESSENGIKNTINKINRSFTAISQIHPNSAHPTKKGVFAKKVLDLKPLFPLIDSKLAEVSFVEDPEVELNDTLNKNITEIDERSFPKNYVLKKLNDELFYKLYCENKFPLSNDEKVFNFYKNIKNNKPTEITACTIEERLIQKQVFNYLREYSFKMTNKDEMLNHYLLFFEKGKESSSEGRAYYSLINSKFILRKIQNIKQIKKAIQLSSEQYSENPENSDGSDANKDGDMLLNRKRELVLMPKNFDELNLKEKNKKFKEIGLKNQILPNKLDFDEFLSKRVNDLEEEEEGFERKDKESSLSEFEPSEDLEASEQV